MLQWPSSISCQEEKDRHTDIWYEVEREENDELRDLAEREWSVDGRLSRQRSSKALYGIVQRLLGDRTIPSHQVFIALFD